MSTYKTQRGMSYSLLLVLLIVAGIFFAIGMKLLSPYQDNRVITSMMEGLVEEPETAIDTQRGTRLKINKRLLINQVRLPKGAITMDDNEGVRTFTVKYDVTVPMFYNVDALVKFNEQYKVTLR